MSNIVFKVTFKDNTHRFSIQKDELTIEKLNETLNKMFGPCVSKFDLKYEDTDGDIITLKSDYDLTEAMNVFSELPSKVIRLKLVQRRGRFHRYRECNEDVSDREEKSESKEEEPKKEESKNNEYNQFPQFGCFFDKIMKNVSQNINQDDIKKFTEQMKVNKGFIDLSNMFKPFFHSFGHHQPAPENEQNAPQDDAPVNPFHQFINQPHGRMPFFRGCFRNKNSDDKLEVKKLEQVTKTWKVKNFGPFAWPVGSELTYVGGDKLSANRSFAFEKEVAPGEEVEIEFSFTAPEHPGTYRAFYRLATPQGITFGRKMRVILDVIESDVQNESKAEVQTSNNEDVEETHVTIEDVEEENTVKYAEELKKLNEMGFYDDDLSVRVLDSCNGDVMVTVERLLSWQ